MRSSFASCVHVLYAVCEYDSNLSSCTVLECAHCILKNVYPFIGELNYLIQIKAKRPAVPPGSVAKYTLCRVTLRIVARARTPVT